MISSLALAGVASDWTGIWELSKIFPRCQSVSQSAFQRFPSLSSVKKHPIQPTNKLTSRLDERVGKDAPLARFPVVGNRLDQVTIGRPHAHPERSVAGAAAGSVRQDESGCRLADPRPTADGAGAEGRSHRRIHGGERDSGGGGEGREDLARGRHCDAGYGGGGGRCRNVGDCPPLSQRKRRLFELIASKVSKTCHVRNTVLFV